MTLHCDITPLWALGERTKAEIARDLCWPGRDLHRKLSGPLTDADGHIAVVHEPGRVVGWARSEAWKDDTGWEWPTLEAFVRPELRRSGVAAFATAGLVASVFSHEGYGCAVFSPSMLLVAARAGLHPTLFERVPDGAGWRRASE